VNDFIEVISVIATEYKTEREKYLGYVESAAGIGLLLGPIIGSLLYYAGGYFVPFAALGGCYFLIWPVITRVLVKLRRNALDAPQKVKD
jgi:MFS family permease